MLNNADNLHGKKINLFRNSLIILAMWGWQVNCIMSALITPDYGGLDESFRSEGAGHVVTE